MIKNFSKKSAVSLIETLLSLSIVGVSLVALLPVMSLNGSNTVDRGNKYWSKSGIPNSYIAYTDNQNVRVTIDGASYNDAFTLAVNNGLYITKRLNWYGTEIEKDTDYLFMHAHDTNNSFQTVNDAVNNRNFVIYPQQLYMNSNNNSIVIEQGNDTSSADNASYFFSAKYDDDTAVVATDKPYRNVPVRENHLYSISHGGHEKLFVDAHNGTIGIGQNAAKYNATPDFIGIYNDSQVDNTVEERNINGMTQSVRRISDGATPPTEDTNSRYTLLIGAKTPNPGDELNLNNPTDGDFVISRTKEYDTAAGNAADKEITINANLSAHNIKTGSIVFTSDKRLKNILREYTKGIEEILQIKPVEYTFKQDEKKTHHIGVIAQDLRKPFPEAVKPNKETGYLTVNTEPIFYALVNAIKSLNDKNTQLHEKNIALEKKITALRKAQRQNNL